MLRTNGCEVLRRDAALRRLLLERLAAAGLRGDVSICSATSPCVIVTPSSCAAFSSTSC
jgi:hypothetical protein